MTVDTPPREEEQHTPAEAVTTTLRDRLQQFLAFASLIAIFLFFSIASSSFLNYSNVTSILFSTVVIGARYSRISARARSTGIEFGS